MKIRIALLALVLAAGVVAGVTVVGNVHHDDGGGATSNVHHDDGK